ncbi:MAG: LysR family transcriptional regulator [Pseudomonadota bacterium]
MSRFDRLTLLTTFVRIAERGSMTAAASDLGLSQPAVSRQLIELERQLGVELIHRTTHSLALTEEGRTLMGEARMLLRGWEEIGERIAGEDALAGPIRAVAPIALGQRHAARAAIVFQQAHPEVTVSWTLTDTPIRFDEEGCDCWIRVGDVPDDRLIVRTIGHVERIVVGAPRFAEAVGGDLSDLPWVTLGPFEGDRIALWDDWGESCSFRGDARLETNNIHALTEAVLAGIGVAIVPRWFVEEEIAARRLIEIAPGLRARSLPISIATAATRSRPRRVDAFVKAMTEWLEENLPLVSAARR